MSDNKIFEEIDLLVQNNNVVLFMKGSAKFPQCGFSASVVSALNNLGVEFKDVNVLENMNYVQRLKIIQTGQLSHNYTLKVSLLADVT